MGLLSQLYTSASFVLVQTTSHSSFSKAKPTIFQLRYLKCHKYYYFELKANDEKNMTCNDDIGADGTSDDYISLS